MIALLFGVCIVASITLGMRARGDTAEAYRAEYFSILMFCLSIPLGLSLIFEVLL